MRNLDFHGAIAVMVIALTLVHGTANAAETAKAALTVAPVSPQKQNWSQNLPVAGEVTAWQESIIGSEVGQQRIVEVKAQVGDIVRKGALLARIADDTIAAELAQAEALLAETDALLAEARANAERAKSLREKGFYSPQQGVQYDTAQAASVARRASALAAVQGARARMAQTRVLAPDDGVISARSASVGSLTAPGQELFRLIRQGRLEWRAEVPEAHLSGIKPGMAARITTVAGTSINGKVRTISPAVDPKTRNAIVFVDLEKPADKQESAARAGMFVRGELEFGRADVLTIPQTALVLRDGFAYVFTLEGPQVGAGGTAKVRMTKVEAGRRQGERVAITSGLTERSRLVATGAGFLTDGDNVRVEVAVK